MNERIKNLLEKAGSDDKSSVSCTRRTLSDAAQAERIFSKLKDKILDIEEWNDCSAMTSYQLFDENGESSPSQRLFEGVFSRMAMKGTGKYDWVRVVEIFDAANAKIITVKPAADPTEKIRAPQTSHFFESQSSNNFCLMRDAQSITFYVIGLREKQNTSETDGVIETIRNIAVANIGSYFGIQKAEWENFCENFLGSEN